MLKCNCCGRFNMQNTKYIFFLQGYSLKMGYVQPLRRYCTPDQFCDYFCIFLKIYNILVTSKIYFLLLTFQPNFTEPLNSIGYWFMPQKEKQNKTKTKTKKKPKKKPNKQTNKQRGKYWFSLIFYCNFTTMISAEVKLWVLSPLEQFWLHPQDTMSKVVVVVVVF